MHNSGNQITSSALFHVRLSLNQKMGAIQVPGMEEINLRDKTKNKGTKM